MTPANWHHLSKPKLPIPKTYDAPQLTWAQLRTGNISHYHNLSAPQQVMATSAPTKQPTAAPTTYQPRKCFAANGTRYVEHGFKGPGAVLHGAAMYCNSC